MNDVTVNVSKDGLWRSCLLSWLRKHGHFFWSSAVISSFVFLVILRLYDFTGGYQLGDASLYSYWAAGGGENLPGGDTWFITIDDIPWMQIYITRGIFSLLGVSEFSSRLYVGVCGCLLLVMVYLLGRRISNRYGGLLSMLIVGLSPQTIVFSRVNVLDVPLALWLTLATYYALDAPKSTWRSGLCGVFCGLAFFTKYTGLVSLVLAAYPVVTGRWRNALVCFLTFGLVSSPLWYELAALKWHPFIYHAGMAEVGVFFVANYALSSLLDDIGLFLPIGIGALLAVVLARRLDRRVFAPSLLLISMLIFFLMIRRWSPKYIVDLLPSFAVVAAYFVTRISELSHKVLRVCIVGGIIGVLVINSFAATSFVAAFTSNNSWKIVGGVAQGFAHASGCPIVVARQDWESFWYFRDENFHTLPWVVQTHPNRFITVFTPIYLGQIKDYIRAWSGLTYHEVVLWESPTFVEWLHPPTDLDVLRIWLFTADSPPGLYPSLTRTC